MIDNFELIEKLFDFTEEDNTFFHCQIVKRAKDHKPNKVKEGAIRTYLIKSKDHLKKLKEEIILLCEHHKARAYINVAKKTFDSVNKLMLTKLAEYNYSDNLFLTNPQKLLNSSIGEIKPKTPLWVVDIDDINIKTSILEWLDKYFYIDIPPHFYNRDYYLKAEIPTIQGCHLITSPFNVKLFSDAFPNIDIHKNSMGTLLYYPKSLNSNK